MIIYFKIKYQSLSEPAFSSSTKNIDFLGSLKLLYVLESQILSIKTNKDSIFTYKGKLYLN